MALALTCGCGKHFEVDESFAGQEVSCPECQNSVRAPSPLRTPVQTSDWAIASAVLALVGAFTVVGTVLAVILGIVALVSISRNKERLAGIGYAVFGIAVGVAFTGLSIFAYSSDELFGVTAPLRQRDWSDKSDDPRDLEVSVAGIDSFQIARPTHHWRVAKPTFIMRTQYPLKLLQQRGFRTVLLLVNPSLDGYMDVEVGPGVPDLTQFQEELIDSYRKLIAAESTGLDQDYERVTAVEVLDKSSDRTERAEMHLRIRVAGHQITYWVRLLNKPGGRLFVLRAWTGTRHFARQEAEIRQLLDSFKRT